MKKIVLMAVVGLGLAGIVQAAALTAEQNTPQVSGQRITLPVASNEVIYAGAMVVWQRTLLAAVNASDLGTNDAIVVGVAESSVDNSGANYAADKTVNVLRGVFGFARSTSAITRAYVGKPVYVSDNQTVKPSGLSGSNTVAGTVVDVDAAGIVWVDCGVKTLELPSVAIGILTTTGNGTIGGALGVTGNGTIGGNAVVAGAITGATLRVTGDASAGGNFVATGAITGATFSIVGTTNAVLAVVRTGTGLTNSLCVIVGGTTNIVKENI